MLSVSEVLGGLALSSGVLAIMAASEIWSRLGRPRVEWTRKLIHAGSGLCCAFYPFVIESPVLMGAIMAGFSAFMSVANRIGFMKSLHGVKRRSYGTHYFTIAITILFALTHHTPWVYVCAVLVLGLADAAAAVVGLHVGRLRFTIGSSTKSVEGSGAFAAVAFAVVAATMLAMSGLPAGVCLAYAALTAVVATVVEAVAASGSDNLLVPMAVYVVLSLSVTGALIAAASVTVILAVNRARRMRLPLPGEALE